MVTLSRTDELRIEQTSASPADFRRATTASSSGSIDTKQLLAACNASFPFCRGIGNGWWHSVISGLNSPETLAQTVPWHRPHPNDP